MQPGLPQQLIKQLRTRNALPPVAALLAGYSLNGLSNLDSRELTAAALSVICFMFFFTLQNDFVDEASDNAGKRAAPLNQGQLDLASVTTWYRIFLIAGGVVAMATANITIIFLLLFFAVLGWQYNQPPVQSSGRPVLSILSLGLILSTVPFFIGLALTGKVTPVYISLAISLFFHRAAVSLLKDYKDYEEDDRFNKLTFLIRYGARLTNRLSLIASATGYAAAIFIILSLVDSLEAYLALCVSLVIAGYSVFLRFQLSDKKQDYKNNAIIFQQLFDYSIYFDLTLVACLLIS